MKRKRYNYRWQWLGNEWGERLLILLLICAFPLGLYIMWSEARWRTVTKALITAAWALVLVLFVYVCFGTSVAYDEGGIIPTAVSINGQMLGPLPPESIPATTHLLKNKDTASELISEPTPTPVPTYVYCNDNGVNYHLSGCRYVYSTTPRVTLTQALNAGKTACKICKPPVEETYGN